MIPATSVSGVFAGDEADVARTTLRQVDIRLLPFLFVLYIFNYLDRSNIAIAALQMNRDLGLSAAAYGLGAGIFFIGYVLFEVPSNLVLARVGARWWIARIMLTWGLIASGMMFVRTPAQFYTLRFLLGAAEAGFFPGVIYYLSQWYPAERRARAISRFMIAIPLSSVIGGPLGGWLLGLHGLLGLEGWQWLFLVEGIPSILLSVAVLAFLTDRIEDARWLTGEQRAWLATSIARERDDSPAARGMPSLKVLVHPLVWLIGLTFFLLNTAAYSYVFWAPTLIREALHTSDAATGLVIGAIACISALAMLAVGVSSDRSGERCLHTAACGALGAIGCIGVAFLQNPAAQVASLALIAAGFIAYYPVLFCLPTMLLSGRAAAAGIGLVNAISSVGGFAGPWFVGALKDATGNVRWSFITLAGLGVLASALCLALRRQPVFSPQSTEPRGRRGEFMVKG
jgi:ACS family tartrate transporter-like MFS transporter